MATVSLFSCKSDSDTPYVYGERFVNNVYINNDLTVFAGKVLTLQGRGFQEGDEILFVSATKEFSAPLQDITSTTAQFAIPELMEKGTYQLYIVRGMQRQNICSIKIWITTDFNVPDKPGFNVKGAVYCQKTGIPGVRVSDGYVTTTTDENGFYWLNSEKRNGYVFINLPSGYMPMHGDNVVPGFWTTLDNPVDTYDECNFELKEVDNERHYVIFGADLHLSDRESQIHSFAQFEAGYMANVRELTEQYGADRTYTIMLGDVTWDKYWYSTKFSHQDFRNLIADYPHLFFNDMGNHDNDPYVQGNIAGEAPYKRIWGPNYYAINIGQIHYIILDSISWINTDGAQGKVGQRNYHRGFVDAELNWLKEDLAAIEDKTTPIVVCAHVPLYNNYNSTFANVATLNGTSTADFVDAVKDFTNVIYLSGHTHRNATKIVNEHLIDHNVAAVCECWWWGGQMTGRGICSDGSPAGLEVYEVNGRDIQWYYKGFQEDRMKQFYAYDMNVVKPIIEGYADVLNTQSDPARDTAGHDYKDVVDNAIYINVWNYDPEWKVEVFEGTRSLTVARIYDRDPLHSLAYDVPFVKRGGELTSDNASVRNSHMFKAVASSATSTVTVKVTDRFGKVYTETMTRPKGFYVNME